MFTWCIVRGRTKWKLPSLPIGSFIKATEEFVIVCGRSAKSRKSSDHSLTSHQGPVSPAHGALFLVALSDDFASRVFRGQVESCDFNQNDESRPVLA